MIPGGGYRPDNPNDTPRRAQAYRRAWTRSWVSMAVYVGFAGAVLGAALTGHHERALILGTPAALAAAYGLQQIGVAVAIGRVRRGEL